MDWIEFIFDLLKIDYLDLLNKVQTVQTGPNYSGELIEGVTDRGGLFDAMKGVQDLVLNMLIPVASTVIGALLMLDWLKGTIFNSGRVKLDNYKRGLIIILVLQAYPHLIGIVSGTLGDFATALPQVEGQVEEMINVMQENYESRPTEDVESDDSFSWMQLTPGINVLSQASNIFEMSTGGVDLTAMTTMGFGVIAREIILFIRQFFLLILYCTGPLSIFISMFPPFKDEWKVWLTNFIHVQLWLVTILLISYFAIGYFKTVEEPSVAVMLGFIILYLFTPTITGMYFKTSSAGGAVARTMAMGAVAAGMAVKLAAGGAKAGMGAVGSGGGGGGGVAKAASGAGGAAAGGGSSSGGSSSGGSSSGTSRSSANIPPKPKPTAGGGSSGGSSGGAGASSGSSGGSSTAAVNTNITSSSTSTVAAVYNYVPQSTPKAPTGPRT